MLVIDNGDAIRGIAEVATQLDFIVNGYVGTTATQLADGQMASTEGDLYASGADATVVTSITIVNTDSAARTFTLYLKPSGGTSRAISPVSLDLGIGHSFYTDGQRMAVRDKNGREITALGGEAVTLTSPTINGTIATTGLIMPAFTLGGAMDANTKDITGIADLCLKSPTNLTLSSNTNGVITVTQSFHNVDTFDTQSTGDLATISGGQLGQLLVLSALNSGRTVVVKNGTGNMFIGADFSMDSTADTVMLFNYDGTNWRMLSNNSGA